MLNILKSMFAIVAVAAIAAGSTSAYFSDSVAVEGNTFAAGELVLNVDGSHTANAKFNVSNMKPGSQPTGGWVVANAGTLNGFLDIENISVTNNENVLNAVELAAGDTTTDLGELGDVLNVRLFVDRNGDSYISAGEPVFYNGKVSALPTSFDLNEAVNAGTNVKIRAVFDWWSTTGDNLAQTDSLNLDMTFELGQVSAQ